MLFFLCFPCSSFSVVLVVQSLLHPCCLCLRSCAKENPNFEHTKQPTNKQPTNRKQLWATLELVSDAIFVAKLLATGHSDKTPWRTRALHCEFLRIFQVVDLVQTWTIECLRILNPSNHCCRWRRWNPRVHARQCHAYSLYSKREFFGQRKRQSCLLVNICETEIALMEGLTATAAVGAGHVLHVRLLLTLAWTDAWHCCSSPPVHVVPHQSSFFACLCKSKLVWGFATFQFSPKSSWSTILCIILRKQFTQIFSRNSPTRTATSNSMWLRIPMTLGLVTPRTASDPDDDLPLASLGMQSGTCPGYKSVLQR